MSTKSAGVDKALVRAQVKTARAQWLAEEDGGIDDCTAIVCILHHRPMPLHHTSSGSADVTKTVGAISRSSRLHVPHSGHARRSANENYQATVACTCPVDVFTVCCCHCSHKGFVRYSVPKTLLKLVA